MINHRHSVEHRHFVAIASEPIREKLHLSSLSVFALMSFLTSAWMLIMGLHVAAGVFASLTLASLVGQLCRQSNLSA